MKKANRIKLDKFFKLRTTQIKLNKEIKLYETFKR